MWFTIAEPLLYKSPTMLNKVQIWALWRPVNSVDVQFHPCTVAQTMVAFGSLLPMNL
jgi:hypothetical protein